MSDAFAAEGVQSDRTQLVAGAQVNQPTPKDSWFIKREVNGLAITVSAFHIPRQALYSLVVKVGGEVYEATKTDDVLGDAEKFIEQAIAEYLD